MKPDILTFKNLLAKIPRDKPWPITLFGEREYLENPDNPIEKYDFIFWSVLGRDAATTSPLTSLRVPVVRYNPKARHISDDIIETGLKKAYRKFGLDTIAIEAKDGTLDYHRLIKRESGYLARKRLNVRYIGCQNGTEDSPLSLREILDALKSSGDERHEEIMDKITLIDRTYKEGTSMLV